MDKNLSNKVIVITGGARGIGFDVAEKYLEKQVKVVVLLDIDDVQGNAAVESLMSKYGKDKAAYLKCDVTSDLETISKVIINTYQQVDVLINSAGIGDEAVPKKIIDINVTALIDWSLKFLDHMSRDKGGHGGTIINIASIFAYRTVPYSPVYQASKHAVMGFTKSIGHPVNYEKSGVRAVVICPGFTKTNLTEFLWGEHAKFTLPKEMLSIAEDIVWQEVGAVGQAAIEVFEKADSGTAWVIEDGQPLSQVLI